MDSDESGGVKDQGALQDLARVDGRVIDRAALLHLVGDEIVLGIKKQDSEVLDLVVGHCRLQVSDQRLPVAEYRPAAHLGSGHAAGDLADQAKRGDVASRQAEGAKLRRFGSDDVTDAGKVLQECRGARGAWR
jgi:hypothetical protein